MMVVIE